MIISMKKFIGSVGLSGPVSVAADLVGRGPFATDLLSLRNTTEFHISKAGHIRVPVEPRPDLLSGDGSGRPDPEDDRRVVEPACLGRTLLLQFTIDPLFNREPVSGAPVIPEEEHLMIRQGTLKNCPLAACLVAMARSPGWRKVLLTMVRDTAGFISSCRHPASHEWCKESQKPKFECFSSDRHFVVTFQRPIKRSDLVDSPKWLDELVVKGTKVIVTGTLYQHTGYSPPLLHYIHVADALGYSKGQPVWPAIIEKAYAVGRGNHYETLNHGLVSVNVLRDVAGPATAINLNKLNDAELEIKLRAFEGRPVVLDTRDDLPENSIPPAHHAVAVIGISGKPLRVTIFDAANNYQKPFALRDLRGTFERISQVRQSRDP